MTSTGSIDGFYGASASVAGALIGLLFVALSVTRERPEGPPGASERIRAAASLTAFTNALAVSLFSLAEGHRSGTPGMIVAITGLLFVAAAVISLRNEPRAARDVLFLLTLAAALVAQLLASLQVSAHPGRLEDQRQLAALVVVFFLIGIARSWELIDGPSIGIRRELVSLVHDARRHDGGRARDPR